MTASRQSSLPHACEPAPSGDVSGTQSSTALALRSSARLVGIDAARGIALFGMMAVHNITAVDDDGEVSLAWTLAAGKSAALFALLAGVGVAFATGRRQRPTARTWPGYAAALLVRALIIGGVGLLLGAVVPADDAAVILPYYALLFVFAIPLLTLSSRALIALAATIAVVMPVLSHWLRSGTEVRDTVPNLTFGALFGDPGQVLRELALTGVFPALSWMAYLCAGMAVGRALLTSRRTVARITLTGAALVVAAQTISWFLLDVLGGRADLEAVASRSMTSGELAEVMGVGWTGTTPTDTGWWLATLVPHSTTPLDLAFTIGLGLVVLGLCILVGRTTTALLRPLAAAGSMTLTLYSLHLLLLSWSVMPGDGTGLLIQTVLVVAFALVWSRHHARGPLEELVAQATGAVRRRVQSVTEPRREALVVDADGRVRAP
ncbi:heparan-alpha-glucosaminide N-acetyltransferase domain-containing protein [Geodermatophilus sp. URMC 65]